jgi:hypothetical protein
VYRALGSEQSLNGNGNPTRGDPRILGQIASEHRQGPFSTVSDVSCGAGINWRAREPESQAGG